MAAHADASSVLIVLHAAGPVWMAHSLLNSHTGLGDILQRILKRSTIRLGLFTKALKTHTVNS